MSNDTQFLINRMRVVADGTDVDNWDPKVLLSQCVDELVIYMAANEALKFTITDLDNQIKELSNK